MPTTGENRFRLFRMSDPILSFRTVTGLTLTRYVLQGDPPVLTPVPIGIPANPASFEVNPGINQQDIEQTSEAGPNQIIYTYTDKVAPEISMEFGIGTPEIESMIINRLAETTTNFPGWVRFTVVANSTSVAGRVAGRVGASVQAQVAATSEAIVYYIDPLTKLARRLTVVDSNPVGDQIVIGASLALTLSSALAATGYNLYGWVPCTFSNATIMGPNTILQIGVYATGICFDETVRIFNARRCAFQPGGSLTKDPKRQVKLKILSDPLARTGMGYDIAYLREKVYY